MVFLIWLFAGLAVVTAAFMYPSSPGDLWPSVNAAGIAAGLYILALLFYTLRPPLPRKKVLIIAVPAVVGIVALATAWTGLEDQSRWQHDRILQIRTTISRGMFAAEEPKLLLDVLRTFHDQPGRGRKQLGQVFLAAYPATLPGSDIYTPLWETDTTRVRIVQEISDASVELLVMDRAARGRDPGFQNVFGATGKVQERFRLTERGVTHVVDN